MSSLRKSLFALASLSALILLAVSAQATTYYVANGGNDSNNGVTTATPFQTIQHGINAANAGDTLQIATGTYYENLQWNNKDLVIQGAGAGSTIINANATGQGNGGYCLQTSGLSSASRLQGVTLTGGSSIRHWSDYIGDWVVNALGGGMTNTDSNLTIANCNFANSAALGGWDDDAGDNYIPGLGGGLYNLGSNPTVTNCTFSGNSSTDSGGGLYNDSASSPSVTNCSFSGNSAYQGGGMGNGDGSPTVTNCTFTNNSANFAGGGMNNDSASSATVTNCSFIGNSAGSEGGGGMDNWISSSATVTNCTFTNNSASVGGGMLNVTCNPSVTNCTFIGNSAAGGGGMFTFRYCSPSVTNCTFIGNSASVGGGMENQVYGNPTVINCTFIGNSASYNGGGMVNNYGNPTVINCILWGNSAARSGNEIYNDSGGSLTITYSDDQDLSNSTPDSNGNFAADPLFVRNPFTNGANDFGDLHLQAGSPCINVGNTALVTSPLFSMDPTNTYFIDLDGNPRVFGGTVDLGAYEWHNPPPVANAGTNQTVSATHTGNPATDYASVTLDGSGSYDVDGDSLTYAWNDGQGHTSTLVRPTFSLRPGTYTFTLIVTDPSFLRGSASVTIIVNPAPNNPPNLTVPATAAVDVGCPVTVQASATDPDGDTLTYSLVNPPSWASINSTGVVTLAPPAGISGSFPVTVKVIDPYGASDQKSVTVTVCPILISGVTLSRQNKTVTVQFTLSNTDGTIVSNVSLNASTLKLIPTNSALPIVYAQLKQGVVKTVQLKFQNVPSGSATFLVNGTSSAGPVCANMTVTVP